jgi:hypothetical protein
VSADVKAARRPLRAVVPQHVDEYDRAFLAAAQACTIAGVDVIGVTRDWSAGHRMIDDGAVDRIVVARRDHIPPEENVILVAAELRDDHNGYPTRRWPQPVQRRTA